MILVDKDTAYVIVKEKRLTPSEAMALARELMKAAVEAARIQKSLEVMV